MKNSIYTITSLLLLGMFLNLNLATAQNISGRIIYTTIDETRPFPKEINGVTFRNTVTKSRLETNDKNSPFNGVTGVSESWIVPAGNGNSFVHGFTIFSDDDGDTFVAYFSGMTRDENNTIYVKGGTGKFEKLDGKGLASKSVPADTGINEDCCMSTWELKFKL